MECIPANRQCNRYPISQSCFDSAVVIALLVASTSESKATRNSDQASLVSNNFLRASALSFETSVGRGKMNRLRSVGLKSIKSRRDEIASASRASEVLNASNEAFARHFSSDDIAD